MFANGKTVALILKLLHFQNRKKQKEDVEVVGGSDGEGAIGLSSDPKSREQMIDQMGVREGKETRMTLRFLA